MIQLISEEDIKKSTIIPLNVETIHIKVAIEESQNINIQGVIGTTLLNKIYDLVDTGEITGATNSIYKTLLDDYIYNSLSKWVLVNIMDFLCNKINNKNIGKQSSDNTEVVELDTLKYLISRNTSKAEFYDQRMIDFCVANYSKLPEFYNQAYTNDLMPQNTGYFSGIELDDYPTDLKNLTGYNNYGDIK